MSQSDLNMHEAALLSADALARALALKCEELEALKRKCQVWGRKREETKSNWQAWESRTAQEYLQMRAKKFRERDFGSIARRIDRWVEDLNAVQAERDRLRASLGEARERAAELEGTISALQQALADERRLLLEAQRPKSSRPEHSGPALIEAGTPAQEGSPPRPYGLPAFVPTAQSQQAPSNGLQTRSPGTTGILQSGPCASYRKPESTG